MKAESNKRRLHPLLVRRLLPVTTGLLLFLMTASAQFVPDPVTFGLWHFDEASGDSVYDATANNNNGIAIGSTITTGMFGNGREFHGNPERVEVPPYNPTDSFTVEAYVRLDTPPGSGERFDPIVDRGVYSFGQRGFYLIFHTDGGTTGIQFYANDAAGSTIFDVNTLPETPFTGFNVFHHIAGVWDGDTARIFVDGILWAKGGGVPGTIASNSSPTRIGAMYSPTGGEYFHGTIDEVRLSDTARYFESDSTIIALWHFDEGSGTMIHDASGNENDGTLNDSTAWSLSEVSGSCLLFNGTSTMVDVADRPIQSPSTAFTIEADVKVISYPAPGTIGTILHKGIANDGIHETYGMALQPDGRIVVISERGQSCGGIVASSIYLTSTESLSTGQWYHVAFTFDENTDTGKVYIDNVLDTWGFSEHDIQDCPVPISIGAQNQVFPSGIISYFNGYIDEVRISSVAREFGGPPPAQSTWQSILTTFDACDTLELAWGQATLATDCIDSIYGELELPPPPPAGGFDTRFLLPCSTSATMRDFRSDALMEVRWKLRLQACNPPITLQWDTTGFPSGGMYLLDSFGGSIVNINMRSQTEFVVPNGIAELWIERSEEACRTITTHAGWNMISLPVSAPPNYYLTLLPDAISHPFHYAPTGYVVDDTLDPGTGYWVKFGGVHTYNICSYTAVEKSVNVVPGWNMIGPFEDTVLVSQITSTPGGIIISDFYHYQPPYVTVDTLFPGKGYWVKVSASGTLYFSVTSLNPSARSLSAHDSELPPLPPDGGNTKPVSLKPTEFSLGQNYPNPFNPSTTIRYDLPMSSPVSLRIFNHLGQEVKTLVEQVQEAGFRTVEWNGTNNAGEAVATGVYFYRLQAGNFVETRKLLLMK